MEQLTEREICTLALEHYGEENQVMMVMEEMAELQKELCKHWRGKTNREEIAGEIADVSIMLEQMAILFRVEYLAGAIRAQKLQRLVERIRREVEQYGW